MAKRTKLCQLPSPGNIAGRSSSITNAFFNAIVPIHEPTEAEVLEVLELLEMRSDDIRCAYCGDKSTEWDHLRPLITNQLPTGFITELANLIPACGKCNHSKGKRDWREWMLSDARLSPHTRGIVDLSTRIDRIENLTKWREPTKLDFLAVIEPALWERHHSNWKGVLALMKESQILAKEIREAVAEAIRAQRDD